jgi:2-methylcitrate dehydratase PrpD
MPAHGAAVVAGLSAHMEDFDDTHLGSSVHASAAAFAGALAAAQAPEAIASQLCTAFTLGCEMQFRIGRAMMPWHYEGGWHITGTVGPIGAAVAVGILYGFDSLRLAHALGFACSQSLGLREAFGTSAKPFHPGKAAANGLLAAEMAAAGLHASPDALLGPRGYYEVLSAERRPERLLDGLGEAWLLLENTYKPYPCGLVIHPLIDLGILLRERGVTAEAVESIQVRCHPIVRELTGNPEPTTPLEARFSAVHGLALGLVFGRAGTEEFDVSGLESGIVPELRRRTELVDVEVHGWTGCAGVVRLRSGDTLEVEVPVARGSLERPLSDEELTSSIARSRPGSVSEPACSGR